MYTKNVPGMLMKVLVSACIILIASFTGCSTKSQIDGGSDSSSAESITITASPSSISTAVTTIIEATTWANGVGLAGEVVTFTVTPASSGTVTPAMDTSNAQGFAYTVFTPSASGQITITASVAGGVILASTLIVVEEEEASTGNSFVWVTLSDDTLRTGEMGTSTVRIEIRDTLQQAPALGTEVVLTIGENFTDTDGDGYYTAGEDQLTDLNDNGWWDNIGTYDSVAYTDASGIVSVVFTGQSDVARAVSIRATLRDGSLTGFDKTYLYFEPYNPNAGNVGITSDVSSLLADGSSTATISLEIRDAAGNPAAAGTEVRMVAGEKFQDNNSDGVYTPGTDQLLIDGNDNGIWDAIGSITSPVYTDAAGIATATFTSGLDPWDVYIKAKVIDANITASREVMIQMGASVDLSTIELVAAPGEISVINTGAVQTTMLTARAFDVWHNDVGAGYPITFTINGASIGAYLSHPDSVGSPFTVLTDETGSATVPLTSGTTAGTINVTANFGTVLSIAAQVRVSAGPPAKIVVAADTCNVPYWNLVNGEVEIIAIVSDIYLNPVNDSTVVYFSTDEGTMKSGEEPTHDLEGRAGTFWMSNQLSNTTADGVVWVYAETAGGTVADTSWFLNTGGVSSLFVFHNDFSLTGLPSSVLADGESKIQFQVTGYDANGNSVTAGTKYEISAAPLLGGDGVFEHGCGIAWDYVELTSVTLNEDKSMPGAVDDGIGAMVIVSFGAGPNTATKDTILLTTDVAYYKESSIEVSTTAAAWGEEVTIRALIKDYYGNPLGNHTLNLIATFGTTASTTHDTDKRGEAGVFRWTAPSADGTYTITITDTDPLGNNLQMDKQIVVSNN